MPITVNNRLRPFGQTIFTEMSALAARHGAVNLGQGFPNFDGPLFIQDAAVAAMKASRNQYARMFGEPELNRAIAARWKADGAPELDPDREITVTSGCQEAIAATMIGLLNPGDEVVLFEPCFDTYRPCVLAAGGETRSVPLRPPDFRFAIEDLLGALTPRTRAIFINTPHNPTGKVFSEDELKQIAEVCIARDLIAVSDEVYERLVYRGKHVHIATLPGMAERTVTLSSLGKTFSLTGWKIGWAIACPALTAGIRSAHQILTFSTATPLQAGAAAALAAPDSYYHALLDGYARKRELLLRVLSSVGFRVYPPDGSYFVMADHTGIMDIPDVDFCRRLIEEIGVAAIPGSGLCINKELGRSMVRFAFCKTEDVLLEAGRRLEKLRAKGPLPVREVR